MKSDQAAEWVPKGRAAQVLRRLLQLSVFGFIVYAAMGGPWRNYKLAHNHRRLVSLIEGDFWGTLYGWNEDLLSVLGEPFRASFDFLGFPWAGSVFGLDTADPLLVAGQAVSRGSEMPSDLMFALIIPIGLAVVLGRVFCSHLCPMRLAFEIGQGIRAGLIRLGMPLPEWQSPDRFGGFVLAGGLLATAAAGPAVWLLILPYVGLSASLFLAVSTGVISVLVVVVSFWLVVDLFFAPGYFCHNLCPTGFSLDVLGHWSRFRVQARSDRGACPTSCNQCEEACPFSLRPKEELPMLGCDRCGKCVVACPRGKLSRSLVVVAIALLAATTGSSPAQANHNKGFPHYGYFENYPQVPVEEYVAIDGPWEISAVIFNFQGMDRRNADTPNDIKIYLSVFNESVHKAYKGPLRVELRQGDEVLSVFDRLEADEEAVYSTRETVPRGGYYDLVVFVGDEQVTLPIHVELASDGLPWIWIGGAGAVLAIIVVLILLGRSRARPKRGKRSDGGFRWAT